MCIRDRGWATALPKRPTTTTSAGGKPHSYYVTTSSVVDDLSEFSGADQSVRWPEGPVCERCYRAALRHRGTCAGCGQTRRLVDPAGPHATPVSYTHLT